MNPIAIIDQRINELYHLSDSADTRHQRGAPVSGIGGGGRGLFGASEERQLIMVALDELNIVRDRLLIAGCGD